MKRILILLLAICIPIALIEIAGSADEPTTDKGQISAAPPEKSAPNTRAADEAGVLVHFANGDTQRWMLARLNKPEGSSTPK